jgi:hypothetical protein
VKLSAGSSVRAAKYVSILGSNMTQDTKAEVVDMMLSTEADAGLKALIQDHLCDGRSLEQLTSVLQQEEDKD